MSQVSHHSVTRTLAPAVLIALAGFLPAAQAATVNYNESVGGDLPTSSGFPIFAFDIGTNTVSGSQRFTTSALGFTFTDFDSFGFNIAPGQQLTGLSLSFTITNSVNPGLLRLNTFLDSGSGPYTVLAETDINIVPTASNPAAGLTTPLPLGLGDYLIFQGQVNGLASQDITFDYTWSFDVAAVPLPSSALAASPLLALSLLRRQR